MQNLRLAIVGLGYVGLPLAVEFSKKYKVIGYDNDDLRIAELNNGFDKTLELSSEELSNLKNLKLTSSITEISDCSIYIITVPTPIDTHKIPDLSLLKSATKDVAGYLKKDDIVIYESTVYPGATEEICVPLIEKESNLIFNQDFFCGYSPERISPGEKKYTLVNIKKITSGSTPAIAKKIDNLYSSIIEAGTYQASSIKVAEAAKVIENTQRDVNVALVNEFSLIFKKLEIDTQEVLNAASTKWNFLPFTPGLVGGHCIGVDPYYLTHKALEVGYKPEMILAGRQLNDNMANLIADEILNLLIERKIKPLNSKILVLGLTFKENCADIRNTKVVDLIRKLESSNCNVDVFDPWVDIEEANQCYDVKVINSIETNDFYDAIIIAVAHKYFIELGIENIKKIGRKNSVIYDVKHIFDKNEVDGRL